MEVFMKDNLRYTILYVRISKDDDAAGDSNSITTQLAILQKYANDHAYQNIKVIKDDGYSGTNFNKPDFQRMLEDIENGLIGIVIVKDMSRFGRNYILVGITGFSNVNVLYAFCYNNFEVSYKHLRKVILS
ncbi:hypothetical protein DWZ62_00955 [Ruminococcus sp. AF34-12]|jgi:site-specific DNA recombinase|nr:recombinase family protein [Ruminococcus bicirculans (ex Wegman et al. 2014)]RGF66015.1 hypothetical protein DWZ62_00955 [Ruminococcus sp. AF34-12]